MSPVAVLDCSSQYETMKPFNEAARHLLEHPDGFLTQLFINYIGATINQMTEERFWADIANEYSQRRYDGNNSSYLEGYMTLEKIPPAAKDHVLFFTQFNLLLFEKILSPHPKYICIRKEVVVLYHDKGHGTVEELIEGLKILAESIKSRRTRFNQFGHRISIEVKKPKPGRRLVDSYKLQDLLALNQQLDYVDKREGGEGEAVSVEETTDKPGTYTGKKGKKHRKGKKGQKKPKKPDPPQEIDSTKATPWELAHPFLAIRNLGKIFRDGDPDVSQGFVEYLKDYTPPNCDGMISLPNPKKCKPSEKVEALRKEERQKVLTVLGLEKKKELPKIEKPLGVRWTPFTIELSTQVDPPPGLSPKDNPYQIVYLDEHSTELGLEIQAEDVKTDGNETDATIVEKIEKSKESTEEALTAPKDTSTQDKAEKASYHNKAFSFTPEVRQQIEKVFANNPYQYRPFTQPSPLINWDKVNVNFPPDLAESPEYLLCWKPPKKSFKVIRNILKRAVLRNDFPAVLDTHNIYQNDLNNLFFYLFTIKNDGQYHLYPHFEFFLNAIHFSIRDLDSSDSKNLSILKNLENQFRKAKSNIGYTQYKSMGYAPWLMKETNLLGVLSPMDFDLAGEPDSDWRYKINQDIREGTTVVHPGYRLHVLGCEWIPWTQVMEWVGQYTAEVEPVWLSPSRQAEIVHVEICEEAGFIRRDLILTNLWSDEIREKYDLPRQVILKSLECQGMATENSKQIVRMEEFNNEICFYRLGCNLAPTLYHGDLVAKPAQGHVIRGALFANHAETLKTPYLTRTQVTQVLRLMVELHRYGHVFNENFKKLHTAPARIIPSYYDAAMLLTEQILTTDEQIKLLKFMKNNGKVVLCSGSYLGYQSHLPTLLGTVRLLSHGSLDKNAIGLSWEEDETQEPMVQNFRNLKKYLMAPPGYDLAFLKYNLIKPEHRDIDTFIQEYSQFLNRLIQPLVPQYTEAFTPETLKELMIIFSPYCAFISFFMQAKRFASIRKEMSSQEEETEINRLYRNGVDFVEAVINYESYQHSKKK